jgi:hypothetical protein
MLRQITMSGALVLEATTCSGAAFAITLLKVVVQSVRVFSYPR